MPMVFGGPMSIVPECIFCYHNIKDRIEDEYGSVVAVRDLYPVTSGHTLIIPKRHVADYFMLTEQEYRDVEKLLKITREKIMAMDAGVEGFNVGVNCGLAAGQSVFHVHIHLIPRRPGDTPCPRGGVRGVIPGRMSY